VAAEAAGRRDPTVFRPPQTQLDQTCPLPLHHELGAGERTDQDGLLQHDAMRVSNLRSGRRCPEPMVTPQECAGYCAVDPGIATAAMLAAHCELRQSVEVPRVFRDEPRNSGPAVPCPPKWTGYSVVSKEGQGRKYRLPRAGVPPEPFGESTRAATPFR